MRQASLIMGGAALALVVLAAGVLVGSEALAPSAVLRALAEGPDAGGVVGVIVWQLRVPRVVLALAVGAGLAVAGVGMQTLVRNPLAEPYVLGISSGAAAGASLFYLGLLPPLVAEWLSIPLAASLGGFVTILLAVAVAREGRTLSVPRLLLAGVALASLTGALSAFATFASPEPDKLRTVLFFLLGSLSGTRWEMLPLPLLTTAGATLLLTLLARPLDAMLLGEEPAHSLGVPVEVVKRLLLVLAALVTGTLVAAAGAVGFVGLIAPHAARAFVGIGHRRLVPAAACGGALFVVVADLAARTLLPAQELPVGVVTALCGVPFFLWLLRHRRYSF